MPSSGLTREQNIEHARFWLASARRMREMGARYRGNARSCLEAAGWYRREVGPPYLNPSHPLYGRITP